MNNIMELKNINKFYSETGNKLHILRNLNLEIKEGEFLSILGRSGSGKSTLLNIMGLLDKVDSGEIWIDKKNVSSLSEDERNKIKNNFLGFVFQFHYLLNEFTALENVMIPALLHKFNNKREIENEAKRLLEIVGLGDRLNHKPNQLSGGEKQRVAIARAMINKPAVILADEPTGNLDEETSEIIFSLFKKLNKEFNQTVIVVTHSKDLSLITDRQVYLKKGVIE
ncbi:MAG: ABC transporter ATP-binding protein [Fusobacterium gastrosuis]|uniref:ABC transporter ATP-binding protein n=1 Tax=Fusobacterium TaxID=848 RepID=UPI001F4F2017|nr:MULTISPECIES: ABC transporter ATP-binding protein [Fusobacterium]MDD7392221.1 ABC transporter ATP-binding protein [Fusobacteriaceae bacterium]MCI5725062.1 ABC transporter ATP-binding protein [Fusobacterium sp.]MCI7222835.1 ABC transporter ATP-binding protein [Fusobacterium sp.]MDD7410846.1 ABC transporter ATP-binding protein [Fusobacteriaceae bacterium]MDY4011780.1 ABC transporter ATP-binding protein [Fusobacterium gastrosuis]